MTDGTAELVAVAAGCVGLIASDADQADAEIAHGAFDQAHVVGAEVAGGEVADEDRFVALNLGERCGEPANPDQLHFETGGP